MTVPYGLEFTEEFFGDPHTERGMVKEPESIAEALASMPDEEWRVMCLDVFPDEPEEDIGVAEVLEVVRRTNTCDNLDTPVEVWIDKSGYHTVRVW